MANPARGSLGDTETPRHVDPAASDRAKLLVTRGVCRTEGYRSAQRRHGAGPVCYKYRAAPGGIAQMGERRVRIAQARGSSPLTSTTNAEDQGYRNDCRPEERNSAPGGVS